MNFEGVIGKVTVHTSTTSTGGGDMVLIGTVIADGLLLTALIVTRTTASKHFRAG